MLKDTSDDRSPMTIAIEWSTRLMTIGSEMALPAAGGFGSTFASARRRSSSSSGRCSVLPWACFISCRLHDNKGRRRNGIHLAKKDEE